MCHLQDGLKFISGGSTHPKEVPLLDAWHSCAACRPQQPWQRLGMCTSFRWTAVAVPKLILYRRNALPDKVANLPPECAAWHCSTLLKPTASSHASTIPLLACLLIDSDHSSNFCITQEGTFSVETLDPHHLSIKLPDRAMKFFAVVLVVALAASGYTQARESPFGKLPCSPLSDSFLSYGGPATCLLMVFLTP
jgi:hypothetical protein